MFISNIRENGELIGTLPDGEVYFFYSDHSFRSEAAGRNDALRDRDTRARRQYDVC